MIGFIIAIHVIICALLITIILIQAGRGGGLVEGFSNVESMFGPKTNTFLTRTTTTLAILFFITCVSLAVLSARQSRSLMRNIVPTAPPIETPQEEKAGPEAAKPEAATQTKQNPQEPPKKELQTPSPPLEKPEAPKAEK